MESAKLHIHKHTHTSLDLVGQPQKIMKPNCRPCWDACKSQRCTQSLHTYPSPLTRPCQKPSKMQRNPTNYKGDLARKPPNCNASCKPNCITKCNLVGKPPNQKPSHTPNCIIRPCWNHKASPPK